MILEPVDPDRPGKDLDQNKRNFSIMKQLTILASLVSFLIGMAAGVAHSAAGAIDEIISPSVESVPKADLSPMVQSLEQITPTRCFPTSFIAGWLIELSETGVWSGTDMNGDLVEIFVHHSNGEWTLILTSTNGRSCIVAWGTKAQYNPTIFQPVNPR